MNTESSDAKGKRVAPFLLEERDTEYLLKTTLEELASSVHSKIKGGMKLSKQETLLFQMLAARRCTEDLEEGMKGLTDALNKASKSSSFIGWCMILVSAVVGICTAVQAYMAWVKP